MPLVEHRTYLRAYCGCGASQIEVASHDPSQVLRHVFDEVKLALLEMNHWRHAVARAEAT
jgi:hypothetical protein